MLVFLMMPSETTAEGFVPTTVQASISQAGQLTISTRFQTQLPDSLKQVLQQGVALHFTLQYRLTSPTWVAYKWRLNQFINQEDNQVIYQLSYRPTTSHYRIVVGDLASEYPNLEAAMRVIGATSNWRVLSEGALIGIEPSKVQASVRLSLSSSKMPKPFQINSLGEQNMQMDSGWIALPVR